MLWLYDEFETDFRYNGIVLNNAYDSDIHWVLNTSYKLTFKYPTVDNDMYSLIEKGMMIKAEESDRTNLFRIKDIDINENDKCITVTAYHYLYDFNKRLINNFSRINVDATSMLNEWYLNFTSKEKDFSYYSDIQRTNSYTTFSDEKDSSLKNSFAVLGDIANIYNADIDMHDKQLSLLEKLGKDTEEVLTTAKNISEFVNTSNADEIVTRLYVTSTFRLGTQDDKDKLKEQHRKELEALRRSQKEYTAQENKKKKQQQIKDEINKKYAKELAKQNKTLKRSSVAYKTYDQIVAEVNSKYNKREETANYNKRISQQKADARKKEIEDLKARQKDEAATLDEEITISLVVESPLINDYPFINEIAISNNELRTAEELEEWATKYFTEQNIDKPKNSIKVSYEQLSEKVNRGDTVILKYLKYNIDERIRIVETHYDPMLKKWKEFVLGEKEGHLGAEISNASSGAEARANAYTDKIYSDFGRRVQEESENFTKIFNKKNEEHIKELNDNIERAKAKAEEDNNKIATDIETKLDSVRSTLMKNMDTLDASIDEAKKDLTANRLKLDDSIRTFTADINDLKNRDFPNVDELRKIAEDAKVSGVNASKKVTELENSVKTELTQVKNDVVTKAEYTTGVGGLSAKISTLEEYKNNDGTRTQTLKNWVQQDTADKLARERTEVIKIIDGKGFVNDTQFSNKFEENARSIKRQLTELNAYKNEEGSRQETLKSFVKTETANQLATERTSINQYIDSKGFGTVEFINQKVKETSDSFSRDIAKVNGDVSSISRWKQTTEGTLLGYEKEINNSVKYRDITINNEGITLGVGESYKFDSKKLSSMISLKDVVSVITNQMIVANVNNLVSDEFRKNAISNNRYTWVTQTFEDVLKNGDEFFVEFSIDRDFTVNSNFGVALIIEQNGADTLWFSKTIFKKGETTAGKYDQKVSITVSGLKYFKQYYFALFQEEPFQDINVKNLKIYRKQNAELIVDGSIEGKHIKAGSMETGHFKAGSVTADIIDADAVTADKLKVDKAFIDKLSVNEALIKKLIAQQAFINALNAVTITGEQITGGVIDGVDIGASSKFRIGKYGSMQPKTYGMQINAPKSESANGGITVQIYGDSQEQKKYQEGGVTYTPLGVYVYRDDNFRIGGLSKDTTSYIMHVRGYIAAKGINNLGVVNYGQDVALRIWNNTLEFYMSYAANTFYLRWPKNRNGVEEKYNLWSVATWAINHGASDIRLKENIRDTSLSALDDINKFKFKSFEWKEQGMYSRPTVDIGVIAQEVEQIDKNFVQELDGVKNLNLANLLTFNLKATQELYRNQLSQDEKILQLENKIKQLEVLLNG